ncbi:MAG TPA: threonine synthase, partial [Candidatus Ventrousia excrementavium]|nr:threonine synthase [Candidatus Ventrousia excrementavium]
MEYRSTRGSGCRQTSAGAILHGLAPDGGLFVPETIPQFTANELAELGKLPYPELAAQILSRWLPDYSRDELLSYCQAAYAP